MVEPLQSFASKNNLVTLEKRLALYTDAPSVLPPWMWMLIFAAWLAILYKAWSLPELTPEEVSLAFEQGSVQNRKKIFFTQNKVRITCSVSAAVVLWMYQRCSRTSLQIGMVFLYSVLMPTVFTSFASLPTPITWLDTCVIISWNVWANAVLLKVFKPRGLVVAIARFVFELFFPALAARKLSNFFIILTLIAWRALQVKRGAK